MSDKKRDRKNNRAERRRRRGKVNKKEVQLRKIEHHIKHAFIQALDFLLAIIIISFSTHGQLVLAPLSHSQ